MPPKSYTLCSVDLEFKPQHVVPVKVFAYNYLLSNVFMCLWYS